LLGNDVKDDDGNDKFRAQVLNSTPLAAAPIDTTHGWTGRDAALDDDDIAANSSPGKARQTAVKQQSSSRDGKQRA
jgi:hypothetical protein